MPTLNAAADWPRLGPVLQASVDPQRVLILDSESTDGTPELARAAGFAVRTIARREFSHGGTRQMGAELADDAELLVYMTQDAVLEDGQAIGRLLAAFADAAVGAAYGRQLPRAGAGPIEAHARLFNYPATPQLRDLSSRERLGIKSIFLSNSFAAYRREALMAVGGFPGDVIFGEDTVTAAKLLLAGWKIAYVAEARVAHSHAYSWRQEFRRYFDIGVLHARERWLLVEFGQAGGEGRRFVQTELQYLLHSSWWLIPSALLRTAFKLAGYRLGRREATMGWRWKRRLSMHAGFWNAEERRGGTGRLDP